MLGIVPTTLRVLALLKVTVTCPWLMQWTVLMSLDGQQHLIRLIPPPLWSGPLGFWDAMVSWFPATSVSSGGLRARLWSPSLPLSPLGLLHSGKLLPLRSRERGYGASSEGGEVPETGGGRRCPPASYLISHLCPRLPSVPSRLGRQSDSFFLLNYL